VVFHKKRLSLKEILPYLDGLDYVLLEGFEEEKTMPKIIAAKTAQEAASFCDGLTIAVSGLIVESKEETAQAEALQLPLLSSINQAAALADLVEEKAFAKLPEFIHCGECGYATCYDLAKAMVQGDAHAKGCFLTQKNELTLEVNGVQVPLKAFPQQILLSTLEGMLAGLEGGSAIKTLKLELKKKSAPPP
jgi:hypothetical protein